jgi:hypothetical protein
MNLPEYVIPSFKSLLVGRWQMSLTEEGYRERKWGHFPALRKVLESKSVPAKY